MSESLTSKYERILSMCDVGKRHGAYTQIRCPIKSAHKHDDQEKSASLGLHSNGISFKCFAGCQTDDFLKELGLTYKDLFSDDERVPTNIYTYHNADGTYHHDKVKYRNSDGKKTFKQRTIDDNGNISYTAQVGIPYALPRLIEAIKSGKVVLQVEGEKDAETAKILGYEATTMGGASDWKDEYKRYFKDANLILIPDKDDPGLKLTANMIDSLKTVTKSLKTMILPMGKDLTEWVEAGNSDLRPLIESATELITTNGVPEPVVKVIIGGYELYWIGLNLKVVIDHIQNGDDVEIAVYENEKPIYISGYKLLSVSHKDNLARSLKKLNTKLNWDVIINQITIQCLSRIRMGDPLVVLNNELGSVKPEYLLTPLFVANNINIIYADRSSAKSLFMTFVDILLTLNWESNPFGLQSGKEHVVLFIDWENDPNTVGWQKQCLIRGMGMEWLDIHYLHCSIPLVKCLSSIQQKINEIGADVIIIDSLGVAIGGNLNDSEPALNFFSALRQLPVTPLIIAHTAKDKNNSRKTVYGNAFYENLARSIWELSKSQQVGSNELILSLYQRKSPPFSGYHNPLGFRFVFDADKTLVNICEPQNDVRDGE
jgi:hypothetical protein